MVLHGYALTAVSSENLCYQKHHLPALRGHHLLDIYILTLRPRLHRKIVLL